MVFSDIASIRFDGVGFKSVVIDNIPAGSRVDGQGGLCRRKLSRLHHQIILRQQIVAGDTVNADFTNDYNNKLDL